LANVISPNIWRLPIAELQTSKHTDALGPSMEALLVALVLSAVLLGFVYALWFGRIEVRAPPEQQREAEKHA